MGSRAAARTVVKPFRLTQVPGLWGFWQSGSRRWVVHLAKNGIWGQPLNFGFGRDGCQYGGRLTYPQFFRGAGKNRRSLRSAFVV